MCGATRCGRSRTITLQLMLPALTGAAILSFIRGIENFESPLFFGSPAGIRVITTDIYNSINQRSPPQYQYATAISFVIMALLFLIVLLQWRMLRGRSFQTVTGKGYSPAVMKLGKWRWVTFAFCVLFFFVTVVLPVGQLLDRLVLQVLRLLPVGHADARPLPDGLRQQRVLAGFGNTMFLGLVGATLTMVLGGIGRLCLGPNQVAWPRLIDAMAWLPWMMPGIVLGVGFLWGFALLPHAIPIYGTIWALLLAYISLGTPLSVRVMSSAYAQLSFDLEECSRVHGASWLQTMWRIVIALAWPSFAVGWVLVFFGIMRELSASVLLYSVGSEVLSVVLLKLWANGNAEQVSVIGLIMMAPGDRVPMGATAVMKQCVSGAHWSSGSRDVERHSREGQPELRRRSSRSAMSIFASARASSSRCSGRRAAARRRRCAWSPGLEQNTGGRISIGDEVVSDAARGVFVPSERRRLGMVFQSYAIWPHMTVFDNVAYPLRVRRRPRPRSRSASRRRCALSKWKGSASGRHPRCRAASSSASRSRARSCSSRRCCCSTSR